MTFSLEEELDQGLGETRFTPFSQLTEGEKLKRAKRMLKTSVSTDSNFQSEAREDFAFHAGHQWNAEEKRVLEQEEGRPALTFPLVKPTVDLILGVDESNPVDVKAEPTEPNDEFLCDILNDATDKMMQIDDSDEQVDDAKENATICGRGFVSIDFAPDPKRLGEIRINVISIPSREIKLYPPGTDDDPIFWEKWITFEDFAIQYPDHVEKLSDILGGEMMPGEIPGDTGGDVFDELDDDDEDSDYNTPLDMDYYDKGKRRIRICHMEYWETYDRYYGYNPLTGEIEEFEKKNLNVLKKRFEDFDYTTIKDKKVRWFQFIGDIVLYDDDSPIPFDGYSIVRCVAYKDKSKDSIQHFGVVRMMKDPQREVNKRWSQTLNLLMKQGQGGYFSEMDAPVDQQQWDESINAPGETTWVNKNAIAQQKFKEKDIPEFPQASMMMQEYSQDMLKKITGVNPDLLGIASDREEPGVVIRMRQQQGLVLLTRLFKSFKRMKKQLAERMYAIIMAYMPDSQLQRILGQSEKYIFRGNLVVDKENGFIAPLRNLRDLKYNITIQESPKNITKQMFELNTFLEMMSKGFPVDPKTVIEKLDLPASEKAKWVRYIEEGQQSQSQMMQQQNQMAQQQLMAKLQEIAERLKIDKRKVDVQAQKVRSDRDIKLKELAQEEREDKRDYVINLAELEQEERNFVLSLVEKLGGATEHQGAVNQ
jgi:hypothetical protein